jgi:serine/threonine protein kinase
MMKTLSGTMLGDYRCAELLHVGRSTVVYRATDMQGQAVVIKILREELASSHLLSQFREEYAHQCQAVGEHILPALGLVAFRNSLMIISQDFGGEPLQQCLKQQPLSLAEVLSLSIAIAKGLQTIHSAGLIHKDISAGNVLFNPSTGQVKIIDFGIASALSEEFNEAIGNEVLTGTLAYMSPEQTGRMNRPIDQRSDFYSFGVLLYQLLTGQLPFQASDNLQWVHAHLAQRAIEPVLLNSELSETLSAMVMRLLAKMPEERYQSSRGICGAVFSLIQKLT